MKSIEALPFCLLITLGKNHELKPNGVGEVLRCITGKIILSILKEDITKTTGTTGSLQICARQETGMETAIQLMNKMYHEESTDAVLIAHVKKRF